METKILQKLGLTKSEIEVYVTLLRLGSSTITPIKNKINIHPSKIYEHLNNLKKKGLVSYIKKQDARYFIASEPESITRILKEKMEALEKMKPDVSNLITALKSIPREKIEEPPAMIYEGTEGFKQMIRMLGIDTLEKGDTYYVLGAKEIPVMHMTGFFKDFHKERIKKGIKVKILFNFNARRIAKERAKQTLSESKYLPKKIPIPSYLVISKDRVAILYSTLRKSSFCVVIRNQEIVNGHLQFFNMMWKLGRKP
ncbi:TrmB family transcriptional regulator [Candidatus Aenigmatarchaeota archaeon]